MEYAVGKLGLIHLPIRYSFFREAKFDNKIEGIKAAIGGLLFLAYLIICKLSLLRFTCGRNHGTEEP
jgi:hypothetical protein